MQQEEINFYPKAPGSKGGETSEASAKKIKSYAKALRERCLNALKFRNFNSDELAHFLGEPWWNVRPRVSELKRDGLIEYLGITRPSVSGDPAKVYRAKHVTD